MVSDTVRVALHQDPHPPDTGRAATIQRVCMALTHGSSSKAEGILRDEYPFNPLSPQSRRYTDYQSMQVFLRDGFVDRYTGKRLVFPGTLRVIGYLLPDCFPMHSNWRMTECHVAFWELSPTVDHVVPIARGGVDNKSNWVCTSMLKNQAKGHWTLEELGWDLQPAGRLDDWDGMTKWFFEYSESHPDLVNESRYLSRWKRAAERALAHLE